MRSSPACSTNERAKPHESPRRGASFPLICHAKSRSLRQGSPCARIAAALKHLGDDISEMLELEPVRFKVIRRVRPKLACAGCDTIVQAPAPALPIERGMAGPGLLAHVLVGKYADHVPLYRQAEIYAREGVDLDRTLLAQWVGKPAHCSHRSLMHCAGTSSPPTSFTAMTRRFRCWLRVAERPRPGGCGRTCATSGRVADRVAPAVWFTYSADRKGEHPQAHLHDFTGILQADGYAGFSKLYDSGRVTEAACWAHARRKFVDLHELHQSPVAAETLDRIGALYAVEAEIRGGSPDERRAVRQERSRPLLDALHSWLEQTISTLSQKSATAKAIRYALSRWEALGRYCDDGRIEIDNNAAERALRCVALGRKNFLFAGSDAGGDRAAAIYSLIGTAKLNAYNPEAFLREVLSRIATIRSRVSRNSYPGICRRLTRCNSLTTVRSQHFRHKADLRLGQQPARCQDGPQTTLTAQRHIGALPRLQVDRTLVDDMAAHQRLSNDRTCARESCMR